MFWLTADRFACLTGNHSHQLGAKKQAIVRLTDRGTRTLGTYVSSFILDVVRESNIQP
jgi:hypothetical protein